jgi:hypothetical protein
MNKQDVGVRRRGAVQVFLLVGLIIGLIGLSVWLWARGPDGGVELPFALEGLVSKPRPVETLPEETRGNFAPVSDELVWDLRAWVAPEKRSEERGSPAYLSEYLVLKRTASVDQLVLHFATTGTAIDIWCPTHDGEVLLRKPGEGAHPSHEYALVLDVSKMKLNQPFVVIVNAIYWNSFKDAEVEDASNYTMAKVEEGPFRMTVLLPPDKPVKSVSAKVAENEESGEAADKEEHYDDYSRAADLSVPKDRSRITWNITDKRPNSHYRLAWTW